MRDIFSSPQRLLLDNTGGFIRLEDLDMLLNQFCLEIKYPTTLLCLDSNEQIRRIDSARVGFLLDKSCDAFRRLGGYMKCLENDTLHALPYLNNQKDIPRAGYEMYLCQYMGYQEYIFPIRIESSIVAVLFVGQIKICDDKNVKSIKLETLSRYKDVFQKQIDQYVEGVTITYEDLIDRIISDKTDPFLHIGDKTDYDLNQNSFEFNSQLEIDSFINDLVLPNVLNFKKRLTDILYEYRKEIITDALSDFENSYTNRHIEFLKTYDSTEEKGHVNIIQYWDSFTNLFDELKRQFDIKDITYYEQKRESDIFLYEIKISTNIETIGREEKINIGDLDRNKYILDERSHIKYILKIEFSPSSMLKKELQDYFLIEFSKIIKSTLNICSYAIRSKIDSNNNLTTLRIYRHEMDQLIFTLGSINLKLSPDYKEVLDNLKIDKMHKDFTSSLESANYITKNIEYFTYNQRGLSNDYGPKEWINIFNKLNKWRLFVMDESIKKHVCVIVPGEEERRNRAENNSGIYCVGEGLESILYNVINNAIKYCHRGSNIYLDCGTRYMGDKYRQIITITDYGHGICVKNPEDIFKLYYRAVDSNFNIDGSGIGLYLSKLIANDIGMDIQYHCEKISDYNLPLLERYISLDYDSEEAPLEDVCKEYNRLDKKELEKIISPFSRKISNIGVRNDIDTPTYKVTFEVII